jgi:hypothetical protein
MPAQMTALAITGVVRVLIDVPALRRATFSCSHYGLVSRKLIAKTGPEASATVTPRVPINVERIARLFIELSAVSVRLADAFGMTSPSRQAFR